MNWFYWFVHSCSYDGLLADFFSIASRAPLLTINACFRTMLLLWSWSYSTNPAFSLVNSLLWMIKIMSCGGFLSHRATPFVLIHLKIGGIFMDLPMEINHPAIKGYPQFRKPPCTASWLDDLPITGRRRSPLPSALRAVRPALAHLGNAVSMEASKNRLELPWSNKRKDNWMGISWGFIWHYMTSKINCVTCLVIHVCYITNIMIFGFVQDEFCWTNDHLRSSKRGVLKSWGIPSRHHACFNTKVYWLGWSIWYPPIFGTSKSLESLDTIIFHKWHWMVIQ